MHYTVPTIQHSREMTLLIFLYLTPTIDILNARERIVSAYFFDAKNLYILFTQVLYLKYNFKTQYNVFINK